MKLKSASLMLAATLGSVILPLSGCQSGGSKASSETSYVSIGARAALKDLCDKNPAAANLAKTAKGILVFPNIVKGGFIFGGFHGDGRLIQNGEVIGSYETTGMSVGLQAGLQGFAYALFFMTDEDMAYLNRSGGWEIGVGPNITVVEGGLATSLTTTTVRKGVYCFFFDQKGLMAGLGLQGSKITRTDR